MLFSHCISCERRHSRPEGSPPRQGCDRFVGKSGQMFLAPDGSEVEVTSAASAFLADAMPIDRLHGTAPADMEPALRLRLGEMGWFSLALPEAAGGAGLTAVEHALFFREVGRQCGPVDLLAQCLAVLAVQHTELRDSLVAGQQGVAMAVRDGDDWRLLGSAEAAYALHVERDVARIFSLATAKSESRPALDPANSMRVLTAMPVVAFETAGEGIWRMGELGAAAMLVGIAERALEMIVDYAKVRETFGRKIGAYQAVRHPCADMALRAEAARCQLWFAAAAMKENRGDAGVHLDAAKHLANQAAIQNADVNIQLHGGIGVTDEHNAHLLLKHALLLGRLFGSKRGLLSRLLYARLED
jgi:alkylation response protein AidB-like acyl-CoA dehydrogenase